MLMLSYHYFIFADTIRPAPRPTPNANPTPREAAHPAGANLTPQEQNQRQRRKEFSGASATPMAPKPSYILSPSIPQPSGVVKLFGPPKFNQTEECLTWGDDSLRKWRKIPLGAIGYEPPPTLQAAQHAEQVAHELIQWCAANDVNAVGAKFDRLCADQPDDGWLILAELMNRERGDIVLSVIKSHANTHDSPCKLNRFMDPPRHRWNRRVFFNLVCALINEFPDGNAKNIPQDSGASPDGENITISLAHESFLNDWEQELLLSHCPEIFTVPFFAREWDPYGNCKRHIRWEEKHQPFLGEAEKLAKQILQEISENHEKEEFKSPALQLLVTSPREVGAAALSMVHGQPNGATIVCWYLVAMGHSHGGPVLAAMRALCPSVACTLAMFVGPNALEYLDPLETWVRACVLRNLPSCYCDRLFAGPQQIKQFFTSEFIAEEHNWWDRFFLSDILYRAMGQDVVEFICSWESKDALVGIISAILDLCQANKLPRGLVDEIAQRMPDLSFAATI
jgi:hypothetical protein